MHRPLRSATALPRALCPAPALPSPDRGRCDPRTRSGRTSSGRAARVRSGGGRRRAPACRRMPRRPGRAAPRPAAAARAPARRGRARARRRRPGRRRRASSFGSRGSTSPRLSPSSSSMRLCASVRSGKLGRLQPARGGDRGVRQRRRRDQPPRDRRPEDGQAGGERRCGVARDAGDRGRQLGDRQRRGPTSSTSPGSTYGTRPAAAAPAPRARGVPARESRRRTAVSAADGSPSTSRIATAAPNGSPSTETAPGSPPAASAAASSRAPAPETAIRAVEPFEPACLADEPDHLADPDPERH